MRMNEYEKSRSKRLFLLWLMVLLGSALPAQSQDNDSGVPTSEGMGNVVKALKSEGRFKNRNVSFEDVADRRPAMEVVKELGYKVR